MFTLPPWPPKDYVLKPVSKAQQSSLEFTPIALPRCTQTNVGHYSYPVFYSDDEKVKPEIKEVHPKIVENWVLRAKAWWVDKPGLNNFQGMAKFAGDDNNDPVYQHKEKVFNRPFSFETDCMEFVRLRKLQQKSDRECEAKCRYITGLQQADLLKKKEEESLKIVPCEWPPPFWYKDEKSQVHTGYSERKSDLLGTVEAHDPSRTSKSWQESPSFVRTTDDPCVRRRELLMVGLPFRNEGCNWYYKNYPPPKISSKPQRFSK
ncbi:uncharacterized protein LOC123310340 [Coccinella septempunctata]|uniref:uncharacterized protein LOC123310340 n=1 Tax=Coccinella septempunctata TaxID=41139 RepID=UPI001D07BAAA|nr:uncharacterized protein LOC123310340 [Coccinella septempunctata]